MNKFIKGIGAAYLMKKIPTSRDEMLYGMGLQRREPAMMAAQAVAIFGCGCLVGAGIALLFAPAAGTQTRQDLSNKANDLRNKASDKFLSAANGAEKMAQNAGLDIGTGSFIR